jgi:hypothetical protein
VLVAGARDRPARWAWPLLGVAIAATFAGAVSAEAVVASDQAARSTLRGLPPLDRAVRITWQGPATPAAAQQARGLLSSVGLRDRTDVTLLNPVRLSGVVVRPAAIAPLGRWLPNTAAGRLARCREQLCPMLLAAGAAVPSRLRAPGVRIDLSGAAPLRSDVPLGFALGSEGSWPLVLSGDPAGLDQLAALSSVYRTNSWLAEVDTTRLHSWEIAGLERRLSRAQAALLQSSPQFGMSAPFGGLDAARVQASAASRSLLLAAGGAIAALALFVVLAAAGLRREHAEDLSRLRANGATSVQLAAYVAAEALTLSASALLLGFAGALVAAIVIAAAAGEPAGAVLAHSLITPATGAALAAGWIVGAGLVAFATQVRSARVLDLAAVAAGAALIAGLALGAGDTGRSAALLAPACCLAAGIVVFRLVVWLLPGAERLVRPGAVSVRLAVVGLARAPGPPAAAIAFVCVSVALGGFALSYRATLARGAADQASEQVPLDAIVAPGPSFVTPLELRALSAWRAVSDGGVFPVRRTQASYQVGDNTATVPALGVPASVLALVHGWRASDGSAPLAVLAHRLVSRGPVRTPGPVLPLGVRRLALATDSPDMAVGVTAVLRDPAGDIRPLALGAAGRARRVLSAVVPRGRWELEALELEEGTGLEVTSGHQNGESATPATQFAAGLALGPMVALGPRGQVLARLPLRAWAGVGAASAAGASAGGGIRIRFQASGLPGVLRPRQPSDSAPVPVLVDPQTAGAAGAGGLFQMTVDGEPVRARVVGILTRFPTLSGAGSFVIADEAVLASALDAQLPGQGRPDELWITTSHSGPLRAALAAGPLTQLSASFRADAQGALRDAPIARAMTGTLLAAAAVSAALALIGLILVVQGPLRDRQLEKDLATQGLGPAGLRADLHTRLLVAGLLGIVPGVALALLLDRLAVAAVGSAGAGGPPVPPLVTVLPVGALAVWGCAAAALVAAIAWLAPRWLIRSGERGSRRDHRPWAEDVVREEWAR